MENKRKLKGKQEPPRIYSENFKHLVVSEYEQGFLNKDQLQRKYDIRGNACIANWLRKYGKFTYPEHSTKGRPMKDPDKQRIKELEAQLKQKDQEIDFFKHFIKVAERELNIKITKKSGTKQLGSIHNKKKDPQ